MDWKINRVRPRPGKASREVETPTGTVRRPPVPPRAAREIHYGTVAGRDWGTIERELVEYWTKLCELIAQHYAGSSAPAWDRIVCQTDVANNGKIMSLLRQGEAPPENEDPFTVVVHIPFACEFAGKGSSEEDWNALQRQVIRTLAAAARREPARSMLESLRQRHPFGLFTMAWYEDRMHPLEEIDRE